jgi:hypothetical protein
MAGIGNPESVVRSSLIALMSATIIRLNSNRMDSYLWICHTDDNVSNLKLRRKLGRVNWLACMELNNFLFYSQMWLQLPLRYDVVDYESSQ